MGRKAALTASVALMAVPTFLIGLLPTYHQIGIAGSALLVLLRLVQGLSVGGEYTTSAIFLVERSTRGHRGFLGSFGPFGACGGVLLGSAIGALVTSVLEPASVQSWGWRVPFVLGISVGLFGLYLRRRLVEDQLPPQGGVRPAASPVTEAFSHRGAQHRKAGRAQCRLRCRVLPLLCLYHDVLAPDRPRLGVQGPRHQHDFYCGADTADRAGRCAVGLLGPKGDVARRHRLAFRHVVAVCSG